MKQKPDSKAPQFEREKMIQLHEGKKVYGFQQKSKLEKHES